MPPLPDLQVVLSAFDQAPIGLMVVEVRAEASHVLYANHAAATIIGYGIEELRNADPVMPIAPEEQARMRALEREVVEGKPLPARIETVVARRDGTRVPVEVALGAVRSGEATIVVAVTLDMSERFAMEEALRESEGRFRTLAEAAPDTIGVIVDGSIVYANPAAARTFGFSDAEELLGQPITELMVPEERPIMAERFARAARGEHLTPLLYRGRRRDGSLTELEVSSSLIEWGGRSAMLSYARDVSERRRAQAELARADRMATIGLLAAGIAHEINNPLTYVMLNLQRARAIVSAGDASRRAEAMESLDEALEGSERVASIVRDLLAFSRGGEGGHPVDLRDALGQALRLAAPVLDGRVRVNVELDDLPAVMAHVGRLAQVFLNLLVNSAQAFPTGGSDNTVQITAAVDDRSVVIELTDNGPGIPEPDLERVFDPFYTTKPAGTGTGLGLAVARSIIESFGGDMRAMKPARRGACFRVRLPRASAKKG